MPPSYTFAYKVTVSPKARQDKAVDPYISPDKREDAFMALVRALAGQPGIVFNLEDDQSLTFFDEKSKHNFRIQYHKIKL